jgi:glucose-induced degradation protein 8
MDYLITEGYTSAAEEFAKEADLPQRSSIDFSRIESRMEIKRAVQRGDIKEAIEKLNDLDPVVCVLLPPSPFPLI